MLRVSEQIRAELNRVSLGLAIELDRMLVKSKGKKYRIDSFEILDAPKNHRYIKLMINGNEVRFNYRTKQEFVNNNMYWLAHKPCKPNYKNAIKYVY